MSDDNILDHRPRGELHVDYYRPPQRFGNALSIGVYAEGEGVWIARPGVNGEIKWHRQDPRTVQHPFLYLDDDMAVEIMRAIQREPVRTRSDLTIDHLHDTMKQRDRVMTLLENTLERQHELHLTPTQLESR